MRHVTSDRWSVDDYLSGEETLRRQELEWGVVREAPGPSFGHQSRVTSLTLLLAAHVREHRLGCVVVSPIDVVLDVEKALVVQPDLVFVSTERQSIIRHHIWGAPDLVVEVLSPRTARRDRTTKLAWYDQYGVRECWLVDPVARRVEVHELGSSPRVRRYGVNRRLKSTVLPILRLVVSDVFSD